MKYTKAALTALLLTMAAIFAGAPLAFAQVPPADRAGIPAQPTPSGASGASPIWVFDLAAAVAVALTVAAMLAARTVSQRRHALHA